VPSLRHRRTVRWLTRSRSATSASVSKTSSAGTRTSQVSGRAGIGAIDPTTGLALSRNPTKDRGVGGKDLYVTSQGLWVGSDIDHIGGRPTPASR